MKRCFEIWNVTVIWVQRNPFGWIRSLCARLNLDPRDIHRLNLTAEMVRNFPNPNTYLVQLALPYNILFPDLPKCTLASNLLTCFLNAWKYNLYASLHMLSEHPDLVIPFHYDTWVRKPEYLDEVLSARHKIVRVPRGTRKRQKNVGVDHDNATYRKSSFFGLRSHISFVMI